MSSIVFGFIFLLNCQVVAAQAGAISTDTTAHSQPTVAPNDIVFNGSFTHRIEFSVPKQRGLEPRLGLSYDSGRASSYGPEALVGAGWRLTGLSEIKRANHRRAVPRFNGSDIWLLDGQELVPCGSYQGAGCLAAAGGTHTTWIESFQRIRKLDASNKWEVTARDGTRYVYEPLGTWALDVTVPLSGDAQAHMLSQYRFLLSEKIGPTGRKVDFDYVCNADLDCRISKISYDIGEIRFHWEERPDEVTYGAGHMLGKSGHRLRTVEIRAAGQMLRTYALTYAQSPATGRSLLASLTERGRDSVIENGIVAIGAAMPSYIFSYSGAAATPKRAPNGQNFEDGGGIGNVVIGTPRSSNLRARAYASLANDRHIQTVEIKASSITKRRVGSDDWEWRGHCRLEYLGNVSEFKKQFYYSDPHVACKIRNVKFYFLKGGHSLARGFFFEYEEERCRQVSGDQVCNWYWVFNNHYGTPAAIGDFDGDGLDDVVKLLERQIVFANGGTRNWGNLRQQTFSAIDVNGDGLADSYRKSGSSIEVGYSNGVSGFEGSISLSLPGTYHSHLSMGDFNGDGTRDFFRARNNSGTYRISYLVGNTLVEGPDFTIPGTCVNGSSCSAPYATDVNGDGRADLIVPGWYDYRKSPRRRNGKVYVNTGSGFEPVLRADGNTDTFNGAIAGVSDADADGLPEIALDTDDQTPGYGPERWTVIAEKPDQMNFVKTPLGSEVKIAYKYHEPKTETDLPLNLFIVKSIETHDGRSVWATTDYTYSGARYDWKERRFRGFEKVTATLPQNAGETGRPVIETTYLQGLATTGKVKRVVHKDGSGKVLQERVETYSVEGSGKPYRVYHTETSTTMHQPDGTSTQLEQREFDGFGQVSARIHHGDTSKTDDEWRYTRWSYPNLEKYLVDRWAVETINAGTAYQYTGGRQWRRWHYFDGANEDVTTPPTLGLNTRTSEWTGGAAEDKTALVTRTFDSFGNVKTEADALGNTTTYVYDTAFNLFPDTVRNPLHATDSRQKKTFKWDKVCGVVEEETDENGALTLHEFDPLCRKVQTTLPGGGISKFSYHNWGDPAASFNRTETEHPNGTGFIVEDSYFDGFGRPYLEEVSG